MSLKEWVENVSMKCGDCAEASNKTVERAQIEVGGFVKFKFPLSKKDHEHFLTKHKHDITHERMWVKVEKVGTKHVHGTLANDPGFVSGLRHGDKVKVPIAEIVDVLPKEKKKGGRG